MHSDIQTYNNTQIADNAVMCETLAKLIAANLADSESKVWHGHPVWFINGNPIVGYAVRKQNVQLLFWSGQSFKEEGLRPEGSFKAAEARYTNVEQINGDDLRRWLEKATRIQWDYKNIVKRKGKLEQL
jgi:hypothetical protein